MRPTVYPLLVALLASLSLHACQPAPPAAEPASPQPVRGAWMPPDLVEVGAGSDHPFGLALAPDGRRLAFPASREGRVSLWLQDLSSGDVRSLPSTDGAAAPFWSPDGTRIGFLAEGHVRAIDLASGSISDLVEASAGRGGTWNAAGDLVFAPDGASGLMRRSADGAIAPLTTIDRDAGESAHAWPAFLADGRHVVYLITATDRARAGIWLTSLDTPASRTRLSSSETQPIVVGDSLLVLNDASLMRQPLDPTTWLAAGRSTLAGLPAGRGPLGQLYATAAADVLIYGAPGTRLRELRWVARDGTTIGQAGEPAESWDLRIAPDGRRIAVTQLDPQLRTLDVWIRENTQPMPIRLSLGTDVDESAAWSPDGLRVAWIGKRRNLLMRGAGAVLPEQTAATFEPPVQLWDWSRDGLLLVGRTDPQTRDDLWVIPEAVGAKPRLYTAGAFNQTYGAFSPDDRAVAYASDESGQNEIYLDSFPTPGTRVRVTTAGGTEPRWRRDGSELYFRRGSEIYVVRLSPTRSVRSVERLFDAAEPIRAFDVTADGSRFLINVPATGAAPRSATMVVNWRLGTGHGSTETRK